MAENKNAKTPADGSMAWGCQCGRAYTVTCISSKPAKQWVGLTDEEVSEIINREIGFNSCWGPEEKFARAVEQALKEKNHG